MDANETEAPVVESRQAWLPWVLGVAIVAGLGLVAFKLALNHVMRNSAEKAMVGQLRQASAALDQLTLEEEHRIFFRYDEVVGPGRYIHVQNPVAGESYAALFPNRAGVPLRVEAPNGWSVTYDPEWPAPARPDGVIVTTLADGRRFETEWKRGVPHGRFRTYYADGMVWGEATCVHGKVVGPSWLFTRDGRKFDELKDGPAAVAAISASLKSDRAGARAAAEAPAR